MAVKRRDVAVGSIDGFVWICLHLSYGRIKPRIKSSIERVRVLAVRATSIRRRAMEALRFIADRDDCSSFYADH